MWAGNAGAHRTGRVSLDYRLREASHVYKELTNLLGELTKKLEDGEFKVSRSRLLPISVQERLTHIILDLNQALKLIEVDSKGDSGNSPRMELISLGEDFMEDEGSLDGDESELSDFECLMLDITHIITCLYKFSIAIQSPAPKKRLHKIALIDVSYFTEWDIKHIDEKFSSTNGENFRIAKYLSGRLGKANTRRRQLLKYYEAHHDKIAKHINNPSLLDSGIERGELTNIPVVPAVEGGSIKAPANIPDLEKAATVHTMTKSQTTVSTIKDELYRPAVIERNEDQLSQTSYATSTNHRMRLRVPSPPNPNAAFVGEPFECPYCFTITKIRDRQDWKYVSNYA